MIPENLHDFVFGGEKNNIDGWMHKEWAAASLYDIFQLHNQAIPRMNWQRKEF